MYCYEQECQCVDTSTSWSDMVQCRLTLTKPGRKISCADLKAAKRAEQVDPHNNSNALPSIS
eukprot:1154504-Amphidinium_carterae.1